ncbi:MAG: thiamine phosphate synthase [Candidatus Adiutrix sp.]|jgi:thiamine-phosphate diphosphorylase|nr:thiamine phosphate synthase [Candidatus Adiutrix sp.]
MEAQELRQKLRLTLVAGRREAAPRSLGELAAQSFAGGATALQLREKGLPDRDLYEEALELRALCARENRLFIINDRLDLVLATGADGLHIGQSDLPAAAAARLLPKSAVLGVSVQTVEAARAALAAGADYLGLGALFATGSKDDVTVLDRAVAREIMALGAPCVAIGGLTVENSGEVWDLGFDGLAVISAIAAAADPRRAAEGLLVNGPA